MTSPYDTANEFRQLMLDAGLNGLTFDVMAIKLERSAYHVKQLWAGKHKISVPVRDKLDALIAAKKDGPEPVDQGEVDLAIDNPAYDRSPAPEPVDLEAQLANQVDPRTYKVFTDPDGRAVVTKVIARFTSNHDADEYVLFLNSQTKAIANLARFKESK